MLLASIFAVGMLLFSPNIVWVSLAGARIVQSDQAQQNPQDSSKAGLSEKHDQSEQKQAPAAVSKPCSQSQSGSTSKADCKPDTPGKPKTKKQQAHGGAKSPSTGPSKTVVRNGGTGEPTVAISAGESQRQASRIKETNRLLAAADLNLKDVAVRGLNASQQTTVKQIRSYMDQARAAANSGDLERAYNLANKANMLAADLNAH